MTDHPAPAPDPAFARGLSTALDTIEVDVDAAWADLVAGLRADRRRSLAARAAAAAAVAVLLLTAGRPLVDTGATTLARFFGGVLDATVGRAAETVGDRIDRVVRPPSAAHGEIDEKNPYWVEVRMVHDQINGAVGWDQWRPGQLDGAAAKLDALVPQDAELAPMLQEAAALIRQAEARRHRPAAVSAHRVIERIEARLRARPSPSGPRP